MTQEEKELLLKDISARLPYGVKLLHTPTNEITNLEMIGNGVIDGNIHDLIENFKPYLFPLESITEEQCYDFYCRFVENEIDYNDFKEYYFDNGLWHKVLTSIDDCSEVIDWFNKNHFDYRNLIDKKLAIDCTNLNIY